MADTVPEHIAAIRSIPDIEADAMYEVTLWKQTKYAGRNVTPGNKIRMKGSALETIKGAVLAATRITT